MRGTVSPTGISSLRISKEMRSSRESGFQISPRRYFRFTSGGVLNEEILDEKLMVENIDVSEFSKKIGHSK